MTATVSTVIEGSPSINSSLHYAVDWCFYALNLYWVIYSISNVGLKFKTSSDQINWSSEKTIINYSVERHYWHGLWWDGTYIEHSYNLGSGSAVYWRRGTPQSDGTISWGTSNLVASGSSNVSYGSSAKDSAGYPIVGRAYATYRPHVFIASNTNGSGGWTKYQLSTNRRLGITTVPLGSGRKILVVCSAWEAVPPRVKSYFWNGTSWGGEVDVVDQILWTHFMALRDNNDTVHLAYVNGASQLCHKTWTEAGGWSSPEIIEANYFNTANDDDFFQLVYFADDRIYLFYSDYVNDKMKYKIWNGSSWGNAIEWYSFSRNNGDKNRVSSGATMRRITTSFYLLATYGGIPVSGNRTIRLASELLGLLFLSIYENLSLATQTSLETSKNFKELLSFEDIFRTATPFKLLVLRETLKLVDRFSRPRGIPLTVVLPILKIIINLMTKKKTVMETKESIG